MVTLLAIGIVFLALAGTPLFVVIGAAALLGFFASDVPSAAVAAEIYRMASAPTLLAIPLFTFAGYLMAEGGSPPRLLRVTRAWLGWMPGGLAAVALLCCAFFTAFTGASGVTIIALGGLLFPLLRQEEYPERFSLGLLTTCGSLGLLFPPSLPLILYGLVAQVDIDQLFLAGVFPGVLLLVFLTVFGAVVGKRSGSRRQPFRWRDALAALRAAAWEIPLPIIVLGGIYGGILTTTEAAAVTAAWVLVVQCFIYRDLHILRDVPRIAEDAMVLVGGILVILGAALGFTNYLIDAEVPMRLLGLMQELLDSRLAFLLLLNLFLLVVGCLMDIFSAIIVVVPLIAPIAKEFGVDPIHLGIIFLTNLEIGYSTPPVGLNLFIASFRFGRSILSLYRASIPFLVLLLLALAVITYWPGLSLYLPQALGGYAAALP
ncbi:MAG: TRAP transporter large permease subunit [Candidatus Schekmanbacteria bacterium]|nr:TRAP transporter large permease subunit [Candidatus Schekmanbacteria bacterium]